VAENDLQSLHRRYVDLAGRFKAAWTYHQFLQGLQKNFANISIPSYPNDLLDVHVTLKQVSESLTGSAHQDAISLLEQADGQLRRTVTDLASADAGIAPPVLRQFFERVKNFDEQILAQMVRFYLHVSADDGLAGDRLDKVDFLLTRLSEEIAPVSGHPVLRDRARLRSIFDGFWGSLEGLSSEPSWIDERKQEIALFRREASRFDNLAALTEAGLIPRYREAKRLLGRYLFHPDVLLAVVETNLFLKNLVQREFSVEEQRILDESQQILREEAGKPPSPTTPDVSQLRRALEEFEQKQRSDNLKLEDLDFLRREISELRPRLLETRSDGPPGASEPTAEELQQMPAESIVEPYYRELIEALEGTNDQVTPKEAALSRDLYHLRLEAREVIAFRRLHVEPSGDADLETFLLEAAAVRHRCATEATEISEILDETQVTKDTPVFDRARRTTEVAEEYVQRFGARVDDAIRAGTFGEAAQLRLLRMRLIRDYSGLWLLVHRPTG